MKNALVTREDDRNGRKMPQGGGNWFTSKIIKKHREVEGGNCCEQEQWDHRGILLEEATEAGRKQINARGRSLRNEGVHSTYVV